MILLIAYIIVASVIAFTYKFTIGLLETGVGALVYFLPQRVDETKLDLLWLKKIKLFLCFRILYSAFIGTVYSMIFFFVTIYFIRFQQVSTTFLVIFSFIWAFSVAYRAEMHIGILLWSSLIGLSFLYLKFTIFGLIFSWLLVSGIGIAYYWGRVDEARPEMDEEINELESGLNKS